MNPINKTAHDFKHFIQWLFNKNVQRSMPGDGRDFRRKMTKFWEIWPMPPKIESPMNVCICGWDLSVQKSLYFNMLQRRKRTWMVFVPL